jgi:hypothetical protein
VLVFSPGSDTAYLVNPANVLSSSITYSRPTVARVRPVVNMDVLHMLIVAFAQYYCLTTELCCGRCRGSVGLLSFNGLLRKRVPMLACPLSNPITGQQMSSCSFSKTAVRLSTPSAPSFFMFVRSPRIVDMFTIFHELTGSRVLGTALSLSCSHRLASKTVSAWQ